MPIELLAIVPWEKRLSVTVGICVLVSGESVSSVRSVGPTPRIPSTPWKPSDDEATPMDCFVIVRPLPIDTVSVNSVPENSPDPYETSCRKRIIRTLPLPKGQHQIRTTLSLVWTEVLVLTYFLPAPTQVFELPVSMSRESR